MPRPLGRDRLEPTSDETIVLLSLHPKPWAGREEVSPRAPVLPGTAVRWDGRAVRGAERGAAAGRRLAPRPGAVGRPVPRPEARGVRRRGNGGSAAKRLPRRTAVSGVSRGSRSSRSFRCFRSSRGPRDTRRPSGWAGLSCSRVTGARQRPGGVARPRARCPGAPGGLRAVGPLRLVLPVPRHGRGNLVPRPRAGAHARRLVLRLLGDAGDRHDDRLRPEPGLRGPRLGRARLLRGEVPPRAPLERRPRRPRPRLPARRLHAGARHGVRHRRPPRRGRLRGVGFPARRPGRAPRVGAAPSGPSSPSTSSRGT